MHVPMVLAGPGVPVDVDDTPISTRRIFHTLMDWAEGRSLRPADDTQEIVLGEAMKPFLEYGWQPQVMAVAGPTKEILAGTIEVYDIAADPGETRRLARPPALRKWMEDYPVPSPDAARAPENLDAEARRRLASLGYIGSTALPVVRKDAPRPADMMPLLAKLQKASGLFAAGRFAESIPLLERRARRGSVQPGRGAAARDRALNARARAEGRRDVPAGGRHRAEVAGRPDLSRAALRPDERVGARRADAGAGGGGEPGSPHSGGGPRGAEGAAGAAGDGRGADGRGDRRVRARPALQPAAFKNDLELGVLYLAAGRYPEARTALDRVLRRVRPTRWRSSSARR